MKKECNKIGNIPKYACQEFCRTHPGQCPSVRDFCYSNPNNPLCKCINSPLNKYGAGEGMPPATCFDNQCANTGYKENSRYIGSPGVPCPTYINASDGGVIENVNLQQKSSAEIAADRSDKAKARVASEQREADRRAAEAKARARQHYLATTPVWKQKYDNVIENIPIAKSFANAVNQNVLDTN